MLVESVDGQSALLGRPRSLTRRGPVLTCVHLLPCLISMLDTSLMIVWMRHKAMRAEKKRLAVCHADASQASLSKGSPLRKR